MRAPATIATLALAAIAAGCGGSSAPTTPSDQAPMYMRSRCQVAADAARTAADALADAARTVERTHHLIDTRSAA